MEELKRKILEDGYVINENVLRVDSFLNHQIDVELFNKIADAFYERYNNKPINKIVTIEASGIAPAILVGYILQLPVVFIKKKQPKTMDNMLSTVVHSFTKDRDYTVCISNSFLTEDDHVIFIDDFLANGNAANGVIELCALAGAKIEAMGFIIEKAFQHGGDFLRSKGIKYEALATVESLDNCQILLK